MQLNLGTLANVSWADPTDRREADFELLCGLSVQFALVSVDSVGQVYLKNTTRRSK